jgi:uncharacterized repeat protein (TIGR01451 family)
MFRTAKMGKSKLRNLIYILILGLSLLGPGLPVTVSAQSAVLSGTVFDDNNSDGVFNSGDAGIEGITVTLKDPDSNTISTVTDSSGQYQFEVAGQVTFSIHVIAPAGYIPEYHPTTPETLNVHSPAAGNYPNLDFGFTNSVATINGFVFNDVNSNGFHDLGEPSLAGAVVTFNCTDHYGTDSVTTGADGIFTFVTQGYGNATIREVNPPGYRSTTPDFIGISLIEMDRIYNLDFGDTNMQQIATVAGAVFNDVDQNGIRDAGESSISGVTVKINAGGTWISQVTKNYGQFTYGFEVTEFGSLPIQIEIPPGYHATTPATLNLITVAGQSYICNFGLSNGPFFTSNTSTMFFSEQANSFTLTATGSSAPAITLTGGTLPGGITFEDNMDGTALLAGTTTTTGTYPLIFRAQNSNGTATQNFTLTVSALADLAITKADSPDPVISGGTLTYTLTITNNGPSDAAGVSVDDMIPAGTTFASARATQGSYAAPTWTIGNLANGGSAVLKLVVTVNPDTSGNIDNTASVSGSTIDPDANNNAMTTTTRVNPAPVTSMPSSSNTGLLVMTGTLALLIGLTIFRKGRGHQYQR